MMPYDTGKDPYLDQTAPVLRNLLSIKHSEELDEAEARLVSLKITKISTSRPLSATEFTVDFYLDLHKQLFGDIYDWAGQLRTVEISKGTTSFARVQYLEQNMRALFDELKNDRFLEGLSRRELVGKLAYYYGELNVLHPFREGNGRTSRTFLSLLAASHGYHIAWDQMSPSANIEASIASFAGDEAPMITMLDAIVV